MADCRGVTTGTKRSWVKPRNLIVAVFAVVFAGALAVVLVSLAKWEASPDPLNSVGFAGGFREWLVVVAVLATALATCLLAWFARRVPEGVGGLLSRLDDAEDARREAEERSQTAMIALTKRLSLPYLHGEAIRGGDLHQPLVSVGPPLIGGKVAPMLDVSLPMGRLPQRVQLNKEQCHELFIDIQRAEQETAGGVATIKFSNVFLAVPVNPPQDDETGNALTLFPQPTGSGPAVALGVLPNWSEFRDAVRQVATHRLPSLDEYRQFRTKAQ